MKHTPEILRIIDNRINELQSEIDKNTKEWKEMDDDGGDEYGLIIVGNHGDRLHARREELKSLRATIEASGN